MSFVKPLRSSIVLCNPAGKAEPSGMIRHSWEAEPSASDGLPRHSWELEDLEEPLG